MASRTQLPSYRLHKHSGQAVVTLPDAVTGKRKDRLLGPHGTAQSRKEYGRVIAAWEARGRRLDSAGPTDLTVAELMVRFLTHAEGYCRDPETGRPSKEYDEFDRTTVPLTDTFPHRQADNFGPAQLKVVRDRMIAVGWCRNTVNQRVRRVRHIWKWAAEEGLVSPTTWHGLCVVRGLQAGRTTARETHARQPVADAVVEATLPHLPRHARGLIRFQRLTGCRPAEACRLRMCEVDTSGEVWVYSPARHKGAWRGHQPTIGVGPQAQALLREFIDGLSPQDFVFSPRRQRDERFAVIRANRKTRVQPLQLGSGG